MRLVLLMIAAFAAFFVWDNLANDGKYTARVERGVRQAAVFPAGPSGQITFN